MPSLQIIYKAGLNQDRKRHHNAGDQKNSGRLIKEHILEGNTVGKLVVLESQAEPQDGGLKKLGLAKLLGDGKSLGKIDKHVGCLF